MGGMGRIEWFQLPPGWLQQRQDATGLSNERIAHAIGIGEAQWRREWKKRDAVPARSLDRVARVLGVPLADVPGYAAQPSAAGLFNQPLLARIVEQLERADPAERPTLQPLLEAFSVELAVMSELLRDLAARRAEDLPHV